MNYNIKKTLTKYQWQTVIDLVKDKIEETEYHITREREVNSDIAEILEEDKAELEEILTELQ